MGRDDDRSIPDPKEQAPAILIVEDEPLIRALLSDYLHDCGFRVLEASSAAEAVQLIECRSVRVDLVFSDVRMPGEMDGIGLAKWVKQNHPSLPIFLASADTTKADLARELCFNEPFFAKPYEVRSVVDHIRKVLSAHNTAGA